MKDDRLWCTECGKLVAWKHKHEPTPRAAFFAGVLGVLYPVVSFFERWRDQKWERVSDEDPPQPGQRAN